MAAPIFIIILLKGMPDQGRPPDSLARQYYSMHVCIINITISMCIIITVLVTVSNCMCDYDYHMLYYYLCYSAFVLVLLYLL